MNVRLYKCCYYYYPKSFQLGKLTKVWSCKNFAIGELLSLLRIFLIYDCDCVVFAQLNTAPASSEGHHIAVVLLMLIEILSLLLVYIYA